MVNGKKLTKTHRIYRFQFGSRKGASPSVPEDSSLHDLNGDLSPKQLKELGFARCLDYNYKVMQKHPEWFVEAKDSETENQCLDGQ